MKKVATLGLVVLATTLLTVGAVAVFYYSNPLLKIKKINDFYIFDNANKNQDITLIYLLTDGGSAARDLVAAWAAHAGKYNLVIITPTYFMTERVDVVAAILNMQQRYRPKLTALVGFSSHGYFACSIALEDGKFGNVAIVPMGASCGGGSVKKITPALSDTPILSVVGERDDWARGRYYLEHEEDYIQESSRGLKKQFNIIQESYYVPGNGHEYPFETIPYILNWISLKVNR